MKEKQDRAELVERSVEAWNLIRNAGYLIFDQNMLQNNGVPLGQHKAVCPPLSFYKQTHETFEDARIAFDERYETIDVRDETGAVRMTAA